MDQTFLQNLQAPVYTPDLYLLEQAPYHLVFDPGPIAYDKPCVCTAFTVEKMSLYRHGRTALSLRAPFLPKARVAGTLYLLNPNDIKYLDIRRENGVSFDRKKAPLLLSFDGLPVIHEAWSYVGKNEVWAEGVLFDQEHNHCNGYIRGKDYQEASKFPDNDRILHNHYGLSATRVEHQVLPELSACENHKEVAKYAGIQNDKELSLIAKFLKPKRMQYLMQKFNRKPVVPLKIPG